MTNNQLIELDTDIFETLEEQRAELCDIARHYAGDYPGTKGWQRGVAAENTLRKFDLDHPEIVAATKAARKAADGKTSQQAGWI